MPQTLTFHFDYLSPYAYFAWLKVGPFCEEHGLALDIRPVLFAGLLKHWGQLGPAEIPPKRVFTFKDIVRYAAKNNVALRGPKKHPFNSLTVQRLSLKTVAGDDQFKVVDTLYRSGWGAGIDYGDPQHLQTVLDRVGLDGAALLEKASSPEAKEALKTETEAAIQRGVFGIPTMIVDGEVFWGKDQFDYIAAYVKGEDPKEIAFMEEFLRRTEGSHRQR